MILAEQGRNITSRASQQEDYVSAQSTSWSSKSARIWSHGIRCGLVPRLHLHGYSPRCKYSSFAVLIRHVHALLMSCPSGSLSSKRANCACRSCSCEQRRHPKHPWTALLGSLQLRGPQVCPHALRRCSLSCRVVSSKQSATSHTCCMPTMQSVLHALASY